MSLQAQHRTERRIFFFLGGSEENSEELEFEKKKKNRYRKKQINRYTLSNANSLYETTIHVTFRSLNYFSRQNSPQAVDFVPY